MNGKGLGLETLYSHYRDALSNGVIRIKSFSNGREWTRRILKWWGEQGEKQGYEVYYAKYRDRKGFMVDLCWQHEKRKLWMQLALESEWDHKWERNCDGQKWDFRKLIYVKAYQKVFIFTSKDKICRETIEPMRQEILRCQPISNDEIYLLIPHHDLHRDKVHLIEQIGGFIIDSKGIVQEDLDTKDIKL